MEGAVPVSDASQMRQETAVAIGIVRRGDDFLVGVRTHEPLAGLAEFPGGKCAPGESPERCVLREVREETGLDVVVVGKRGEATHDFPHGRVRLSFFDCEAAESREPLLPFRWVPRAQLAELRFPGANAEIIAALVHSLNETSRQACDLSARKYPLQPQGENPVTG